MEENIEHINEGVSEETGQKKDSFFRRLQEKQSIQDGYYLIVDNLFLFFGVACMAISLLNFSHDRYCDGTVADHYACVNSATYYEYSGFMVFLFVLGALSTAFWYVKRNTTIIHE